MWGQEAPFFSRESQPLTLPCSLLEELSTERYLQRRSKPGVKAGVESLVTTTARIQGCSIALHSSSRGTLWAPGLPKSPTTDLGETQQQPLPHHQGTG